MRSQAKKKILVVEDSRDILGLTTHILISRGYEAIPLYSGHKALETTRSQRPDLVILDMFLEDENGLDICHAIKSDPQLAKTPVLLTTGDSLNHDSSPNKSQTAPDGYLFKPFDIDELLKKVSDLLDPIA